MRNAFFDELTAVFRDNPDVVFMTGDLGFKLFDSLTEIDPARTINFGIREAAMCGFAAGLARGGMRPFIYSIVPFVTLRILEQIKIDLCYNNNRVVVVGVGGGVAYGPNGPTHHGVEDAGILSCLPNMTVWTPSDPTEVRSCVRGALDLDGPAYLRLGRNGEPVLNDPAAGLPDISEPRVIADGADGLIITNGFILHQVLGALEILKEKDNRPKVLQITRFRPFPGEAVLEHLAGNGPVLTVEEHVPTGGLGLEVAMLLAGNQIGRPFKSLCLPLAFADKCYTRETMLARAGLDPESIAAQFLALVEQKG